MPRVRVTTSGPNMEEMGEELVEKVSSKTHIPFWGVVLILLVILSFVLLVFYCCCQRWWKKWKGDKAGKGLAGGKVDIRSVQLLGQTYKEKVRNESLSRFERLTLSLELDDFHLIDTSNCFQ